MAASGKIPANPVVMAVDIGGSHVKFRLSNSAEEHRDVSGPGMTGPQMIDKVTNMAKGLSYDVVSIGYPGAVSRGKIALEPHNLGTGWKGLDFAAFGKPVKLVNDALMQAIGSYEGGRMLFLGLGTGLGAALVLEGVAQPMELAHLPYKKGLSYEDYAGETARKKFGRKKWRKYVLDILSRFQAALEPDYIVLGGGNADKLGKLPDGVRLGENANAFKGGFRIWTDKRIVV